MRLKTEVEELKREQKKKQTIEPKGAMSDAAAADVAAPALTSGTRTNIYVDVHLCMHICMYIYLCVCVCVCVCVYIIYIYMHVCIYI